MPAAMRRDVGEQVQCRAAEFRLQTQRHVYLEYVAGPDMGNATLHGPQMPGLVSACEFTGAIRPVRLRRPVHPPGQQALPAVQLGRPLRRP